MAAGLLSLQANCFELQHTTEGEAASSLTTDKAVSLILQQLAWTYSCNLYVKGKTSVGDVQLAGLSTCIFISRRSLHIIASLWEDAKATVNAKTCAHSKTHGLSFTPQIRYKGALYFHYWQTLEETSGSQRHWQNREAPPEPITLPLSLWTQRQTQTKHIICNMHQWHR